VKTGEDGVPPKIRDGQLLSIIQRKVLTPNDFANVDAIRLRLALYEQLSNRTPKPFAWKFTRQDLLNWLKRAAPHFLAASAA
jgi:hypothetical protein